VARVVGLLGGSEGASGAVDGRGVAPVGACSFTWAVDGGFSSVCAGGAAIVDDDVAVVMGLLGVSAGEWGVAEA
jgi:hypothetical protein